MDFTFVPSFITELSLLLHFNLRNWLIVVLLQFCMCQANVVLLLFTRKQSMDTDVQIYFGVNCVERVLRFVIQTIVRSRGALQTQTTEEAMSKFHIHIRQHLSHFSKALHVLSQKDPICVQPLSTFWQLCFKKLFEYPKPKPESAES